MKFINIVVFGLLNCTVILSQKDYYKSLGLEKGATDKEIKKSFRRLALKYHPDKSSEPGAEERFREVAEAYQVLRDPEKRRQYDEMGHSSFSRQSGFKPQNFNFDDLFQDFNDMFKEFGDMEDHFKNHFGSHKVNHERNGGRFEFGQDIKFEELFDSPFMHMNEFDMFGEGVEELGLKAGKGRRRRSSQQQSCKTVTQKIGNTVTTYTQCS